MAAKVISIGTSLPEHVCSQEEVTEALISRLADSEKSRSVLSRIHASARVDQRHFVLPIADYKKIESFSESNALYVGHALKLAEEAIAKALQDANLQAKEVDHLFFTTVTGVGAPSLDALIISRMGFRSDVRRIPSFGLGCAAGAAGIARVADYLAGNPKGIALLVSVEICSLTIQWQDSSMANFVGTGLFGDGAAAVVMVGADHKFGGQSIKVIGSRSVLYPETEELIGWKIGTSGLSLMLEASVPDMIKDNFAKDVDYLLASENLTRESIDVWLAHPGGPKILTAFSEALELTEEHFSESWKVLSQTGNLSSAAVLHVFAAMYQQPKKTRGLLFALGPGVAAEIVLLEWS